MFRPIQGHHQASCIQRNTKTPNSIEYVHMDYIKYDIICSCSRFIIFVQFVTISKGASTPNRHKSNVYIYISFALLCNEYHERFLSTLQNVRYFPVQNLDPRTVCHASGSVLVFSFPPGECRTAFFPTLMPTKFILYYPSYHFNH